MTRPVRLRLSRATNGLEAIVVCRPTKFGNPVTQRHYDVLQFFLRRAGSQPLKGGWQEHAVRCYRGWLDGMIPEMGTPPTVAEIVLALRGKNLACTCALDAPCHADVLLEIANWPTCERVG
jgi:hypothetical protein